MTTKQCAHEGCEEMFEAKGARKFCDAHRSEKKADAADDDGGTEILVVPIDLSEKQLDRIWASSTLEEKGLAIQTILNYQRDEEATG